MLLRLLVSSYISVSIRRWVVKHFQFFTERPFVIAVAFVAITTVAVIVVIVVTLLVCRCFKF